jgi:hypothetical protein
MKRLYDAYGSRVNPFASKALTARRGRFRLVIERDLEKGEAQCGAGGFGLGG